LNACDWTATPSSPVSTSRATIEYVTRRSYGLGVNSHGDRPDVAAAGFLHRQDAAPAPVDEDRVLRVAHVSVRPLVVRRRRVHLVGEGVREEQLPRVHDRAAGVHLDMDVDGPSLVPARIDGREDGEAVRVGLLDAAKERAAGRAGPEPGVVARGV